MKVKKFFASKLNWLGVVAVLTAMAEVITEAVINQDFSVIVTPKDWAMFGIGVLVIIVRTWFTKKEITFKRVRK